jgi:hypothetical protein
MCFNIINEFFELYMMFLSCFWIKKKMRFKFLRYRNYEPDFFSLESPLITRKCYK